MKSDFRGNKKIELFRTSDQFEAVVGPVMKSEDTYLYLKSCGLRSTHQLGKIWVEKVKRQLTASLTTTVKLPWGKGLTVILQQQRMISVSVQSRVVKKKERACLAKLPWINRDMKPISVRTPGLLQLPAPDTVVISLNQLNLNPH